MNSMVTFFNIQHCAMTKAFCRLPYTVATTVKPFVYSLLCSFRYAQHIPVCVFLTQPLHLVFILFTPLTLLSPSAHQVLRRAWQKRSTSSPQ